MIPLFLILGALGLAAGAGAAQAQKPKPLPTVPASQRRRRRPRSTVRRLKPPKPIARATVRAIRRRMTSREKALVKKLRTGRIRPTKQGQRILQRLFALAAHRRRITHPTVRKAAKKKIKEIVLTPKKKRPAVIKSLPAQAKRDVTRAIVKADATTTPTPRQAARALKLYTKEGGWQGTKDKPSTMVKNSQRLMGDPKPDGVIGPGTRRLAKSLGSVLYRRTQQARGAYWRAK